MKSRKSRPRQGKLIEGLGEGQAEQAEEEGGVHPQEVCQSTHVLLHFFLMYKTAGRGGARGAPIRGTRGRGRGI